MYVPIVGVDVISSFGRVVGRPRRRRRRRRQQSPAQLPGVTPELQFGEILRDGHEDGGGGGIVVVVAAAAAAAAGCR